MEDKCVYVSKKLSGAEKKCGTVSVLTISTPTAPSLERAEDGFRTMS